MHRPEGFHDTGHREGERHIHPDALLRPAHAAVRRMPSLPRRGRGREGPAARVLRGGDRRDGRQDDDGDARADTQDAGRAAAVGPRDGVPGLHTVRALRASGARQQVRHHREPVRRREARVRRARREPLRDAGLQQVHHVRPLHQDMPRGSGRRRVRLREPRLQGDPGDAVRQGHAGDPLRVLRAVHFDMPDRRHQGRTRAKAVSPRATCCATPAPTSRCPRKT
jgi:hypothetical protein